MCVVWVCVYACACGLPTQRGLFLQLRRNFPTCLPAWKSPPRALRASHSEALLSPAGSGLPGAPLQTLSEEELMIQSAGERAPGRVGLRHEVQTHGRICAPAFVNGIV